MDTEWPVFYNNGIAHPTEFVAGLWKCPLCCHTTPRISQHLTSHKDLNLESVKTYCKEVAVIKRRELERGRAQKPEHREALRRAGKKADEKRAQDPGRREALRKADAKREPKRVENPGRREALRKADAKREPK